MTTITIDQPKVTGPAPTPAWGAVYAMTLCSFVLVASEFMPVSLLSPIASDLHLTTGQAGQAISVSGLLAIIASLSIGRLADGVDRRTVLLGLTALLIVSGALVAFAPSYRVLMVGRAILGIAIGGFWSMSAAIAMRLVPPHAVPRALAILNGGNALATVIGAPLGSFLGGLIGWRLAFFCVVPLAVAATAWQALALPALSASRGDGEGEMIALLRHRAILIGLAGAALLFMGQFALYTYLRPFLEQVTHVGPATLSTLLLVVGVAGFVGTTLIGRLIGDRLHLLLAAMPAMMAVAAIGLAMSGSSVTAVAVLLAIWGLIGTAAPVGWWTWVTRAAPYHAEAGGGLMSPSSSSPSCPGRWWAAWRTTERDRPPSFWAAPPFSRPPRWSPSFAIPAAPRRRYGRSGDLARIAVKTRCRPPLRRSEPFLYTRSYDHG